MNGLRRRIAKLERTLTDESGLTPGSPAWIKYWFAEIDRGIATEFVNSPLLPPEAVRMWMRAQPDESQS
jgi:hypothetical protein